MIALYDHRVDDDTSLKGITPESCCCVDCNVARIAQPD
jgi:hypothetical protein